MFLVGKLKKHRCYASVNQTGVNMKKMCETTILVSNHANDNDKHVNYQSNLVNLLIIYMNQLHYDMVGRDVVDGYKRCSLAAGGLHGISVLCLVRLAWCIPTPKQSMHDIFTYMCSQSNPCILDHNLIHQIYIYIFHCVKKKPSSNTKNVA